MQGAQELDPAFMLQLRVRMPQLKITHTATKIPHATTKTQCSQINKQIFLKRETTYKGVGKI